jgi:hypothetical protein
MISMKYKFVNCIPPVHVIGVQNLQYRYLKSVLRIRDVYPGSRILIFTHPGSRIPEPKTATKNRGEKILFLFLIC